MALPITTETTGKIAIKLSTIEAIGYFENFINCDLCLSNESPAYYYIPILDVLYCEKCYLAWAGYKEKYTKEERNLEKERFDNCQAFCTDLETRGLDHSKELE